MDRSENLINFLGGENSLVMWFIVVQYISAEVRWYKSLKALHLSKELNAWTAPSTHSLNEKKITIFSRNSSERWRVAEKTIQNVPFGGDRIGHRCFQLL